MHSSVIKWRRQRAISRVIKTGKKLDKLIAARYSINSEYDHLLIDADYLDAKIDALTRKRERDLDFIRNTA